MNLMVNFSHLYEIFDKPQLHLIFKVPILTKFIEQSEVADQNSRRNQTVERIHAYRSTDSYLPVSMSLRTFTTPFSDAEAAAEEAAAEEDEDEAVAEGDGDGDFPQEEDEGRDSGGYYEDEEPEGEPYESQQTSDSGHSVPDFTADVDIQKSEMMSEEETKPVPEPEPEASVEQQKGDFYGYTCNMKNTL